MPQYEPLHTSAEPPPEPPRPPRPPLAQRVRAAPLTFALIAIDIAVFLAAEAHGSTLETETLIRFGAGARVLVRAGDYWRLVTPMFLHIGWMHLASNTYFGFGWCAAVERVLGTRRFALIYLLSGVGGSAASTIFQNVLSAGASGALYGVIGATLILRHRMLGSWKALAADPATRSVLVNIAIWTAITYSMGVDNFAHAGGFVTGGAVAWAATAKTPAQRAASWGAFGVAFAALLFVAVAPG